MGCIRSKPIHRQDENEDGYVFDDIDESRNTGFKLDIVEEIKSFERIGNGDAVAAFDLGAGRTERCDDDNTKEKSVDDYDLAKRMQLLRDIVELQMEQLRMARERFHRSIIQRDARRVVQALKRSQSQDMVDDGEKSSTNDDVCEKETESKDESPAKKVVVWLINAVLSNIDYDWEEKKEEVEEEEKEKEEEVEEEKECKSDDEDSEVPDSGYFQDMVKTQMEDLRMLRDRLHRSIINRDALSVVDALKESKDILTTEEMSLAGDDATKLKGTKSKDESPAKEVAIWLLDDALNNIDNDVKKAAEKEEGEKEEEKEKDAESEEEEVEREEEKEEGEKEKFECDEKETKQPDLGYFQFRRLDKTRMTTRRHSRLPPPSSIDIGPAKEKHLSRALKSFPANINASTTDFLLPVPEGPTPYTVIDVDQPIENQWTFVDNKNILNALDQVHSHDLTTDSKPPQINNEQSNIDEDREKRRLQWLANRKSTIPFVHVQQELHSEAQPREIDIDKVMTTRKFPWMRQI